MKVNDWSELDLSGSKELNEKDRKFLEWLKERVEDIYGWTVWVAFFSLQGLSVKKIVQNVGCSKTTVLRKQGIISKLRAEFEKDYWWLGE